MTGLPSIERPSSAIPLEGSGRTDGRCDTGVFDPLVDTTVKQPSAAPAAPAGPKPPMLRFWTPSELRNYKPPENQNIVGDYHIQRGAISVLAGPPGCGKSRAALYLAILGATGTGNWLGFDVHAKFRTLVLQNENGTARLHRDMTQLDLPDGYDQWIKISEPPTLGLNIGDVRFRSELKAMMRDFAPHLLVVDPWNALARDAMEKDYQEAFERLREVLAESPECPACLIVHHLRKPKPEDKHRGRSLGYLLAGSYTILSVPRSALILQPASDDVEETRVVVTPAKNNDGELGRRSAWERCDGAFNPCPDFDWEEYDEGATKAPREAKVQPEHLRAVFAGDPWLDRSEAARRLMELAGVGRTAAYDALKPIGGRYSDILRLREDKQIGLAMAFGGSTRDTTNSG